MAESDGTANSSAEVPYPVEAWERKARTGFLGGEGHTRPQSSPPLVSEPELRLRTPQEVAGRALALFVVAVRSESITEQAISIAELEEISAGRRLFFTKGRCVLGRGQSVIQ